jgi:hypothetical protein
MICPNCKAEVDGQAVFCPECGWNMMESVSPADQTSEIVGDGAAEVKAEAVAAETNVVPVVTASAEEDVFLEGKTVLPDPVVYAPIISEPVQVTSPVVTTSQVTGDTAVKVAKAPEKVIVPKEYKPFSTIGAMGFLLLAFLPVIGQIAMLVYAFGGKNKNRKSLARALLLWGLIILLLLAAAFVATILIFGWDNIQDLIGGLVYAESAEEILQALEDFANIL